MKERFLLPIFLALLFLPCVAQFDENKKKEKLPANLGRVRIIVPGTNLIDDPGKEVNKDSDIQPFRAYLNANNSLKEMSYHDNGEFELDVPEGIYNVVLRANWDELLTYKRAKFYVSPNKITKIRIANEQGQNEVCDKEYGRVMIPNDSFVNMRKYSLPKYDQLVIRKPYDLVIKYCQKQNQKNTAIYTSALLTYKDLTVTASKIKLNKNSLIIESYADKDSKVEIEVGGCIKEKTKITLNLTKLKLSDFKCNQF